MGVMATIDRKNFSSPDERRSFDHGHLEVVNIGDVAFGRAVFEPGWRWSESVKPLVHTEKCEASHLGYQVSGRLHVVMNDGTEADFGPGDVSRIPPGHDAWVVGNEPVVIIDISGMKEYAKPH